MREAAAQAQRLRESRALAIRLRHEFLSSLLEHVVAHKRSDRAVVLAWRRITPRIAEQSNGLEEGEARELDTRRGWSHDGRTALGSPCILDPVI